MNEGRDDLDSLILQQFDEMLAGIGLFRLQAAGAESAANLIVQIDPIGYQNDFGVGNFRMQGQRFCQHDNG